MAVENRLWKTRGEDFSDNPLDSGRVLRSQRAWHPITPLPDGPSRQDVLGQPIEGREPIKASVVLEGGGGKGWLTWKPSARDARRLSLRARARLPSTNLWATRPVRSAGLLAAGYAGDELAEVLKQLDFKKFYSDYLWLSGGVDPKVRGINRTGLFSMQKMYKTVSPS